MVCNTVINAYHFELREISKYLHFAKIATYNATHDNNDFHFPNEKAIRFCMIYIVPIMIGLIIHDTQRYLDFVEGRDSSPLFEIAERIPFTISNAYWPVTKLMIIISLPTKRS